MAQLKDLIVSGPTRLLNDLYVQNSIQVTTGIKIGSANELKSFGTGLSINSSGVLSCTVAGTITGSGTSGYLTKWSGGSSITNGPQLGSSTTTYLRNDGSWATPANTTYTLGTGTTTVTLTPSSGNQQSVTVPYATSAGKATNDASGRAIETTYGHALTVSGNTIGLEHANGDEISGSFITVPYATSSGSLTGGTNGQVLISNGTKGVWTTPTWTTYTFASGKGTTNGFTVTPTGGSATTYSVGALLANEDKRSSSTTPSTYYVANGGLRFLGLKNNSTLGLSATGAGTYSTGLGVAPWGDSSGGPAWELAFNSAGIFARTGTSTWGSWSKLIQAADLGSLAYVSPSTSGTGTTLFLGYDQDAATYSLMDPSSDHLVSQVNSNNNVAYRVLLSYSNSDSTQVNLTYKNSGLTFNPSTGILSSAKIETGSAATSYFQSQRFRGEGDAATYYHAVDFGYANHDRVDFYEYGGIFCFHKHTAAAVGSGDTVLGTVTTNGWEGKLKLPNTSTPITGIGSGLAVTSSGSLYCTVTPCLIEGTKILMADGTEKNIEEIVRGDVIMSYDPNVNQTCEAVVLDCVDTGVSDDYINYFFDNGSMLTVYDKHCFYNKEIGTAKDVKKWELGDTGIDQYGQDAMFVGSEELHYAGRKHHYDLRSSNMLFFANGILNAESLTYNYWWHGNDDLPESFRKAMKADYDSSANLHKHQASRDYGMALAPIIKEIRKQEKIIADNKKLLSDSDYIVQKFTEGLIGAVEWAKAKVSRSGWRDLINTAETALVTAKSRMKTIKAKYATTETRRERFNAAVARDNACLEELKAYFKSKNEPSK